MDALRDASNIENFAVSWCSKGRLSIATKIDIVKPMPPKRPMPNISTHEQPLGRDAILNLVAMTENNVIPNGLPIIKPKAMPQPNAELTAVKEW